MAKPSFWPPRFRGPRPRRQPGSATGPARDVHPAPPNRPDPKGRPAPTASAPAPVPPPVLAGAALRRSRWALGQERAWAAFWPALSLAGLILALALSGWVPLLPGWLHLLVLVASILALGAGVALGLRHFAWPSLAEARHRLETGAGTPHRPLSAAGDHLALGRGDPLAEALWHRHQAQARAAAAGLRAQPPRPVVAERDPLALRAVPVLLLAVALIAGRADPGARLLAFVSPTLSDDGPPPRADVWLTPPDHTGLAPVHLGSDDPHPAATTATTATAAPTPTTPTPASDHAGPTGHAGHAGPAGPTGHAGPRASVDPAPLSLPQGSRVLVVIQGAPASAVRLRLNETPLAVEALADRSLRAEARLDEGGRLVLTAGGHRLIDQRLILTADQPPQIAFSAPPDGDSRGRLTLPLAGHDDYGLVRLGLTLTPLPVQGDETPQTPGHAAAPVPPPPPAAETRDIPLQGTQPRNLALRARLEVGDHPWAGRPARLVPWVEDAAGQRAEGPAADVTLPQRSFAHPVARALIEQRRRLLDDPGQAFAVARTLDRLSLRPDTFDTDLGVFLALRTARAALIGHIRILAEPDAGPQTSDRADDETGRISDLLWDAAIALEDGADRQRLADLATLRDRIGAALDGDLTPDALARLLADTREALNQVLRGLARRLADLGADPTLGAGLPPDLAGPGEVADLDRLLDSLAEMNRLGAQEAVRALLAELDRTLQAMESLRLSREDVAAMQAASALATALDAVRRDQSRLLTDTFRELRAQAQARGEPAPDPGAQAMPEGDMALPSDLLRLLPDWPEMQRLLTLPDSPPDDPRDPADPADRRHGADDGSPPPTLPSDPGDLAADETGPPPDDLAPGIPAPALAARQTALQDRLIALLAEMGEATDQIPPTLGEAALAMEQATLALADGALDEAMHHQEEVLRLLSEGRGEALGQMMQAMGGGGPGLRLMLPLLGGGPGEGTGRDPLGRGHGRPGGGDTQGLPLPDGGAAHRARAILEELHRRANDSHRPADEQEYLKRLIPAF